MIPSLLLAAGIFPQVTGNVTPQGNGKRITYTEVRLLDPDGGQSRLSAFAFEERLSPPKLSPKLFDDPPTPWEFEWLTGGYVRTPSAPDNQELRFRVYSQVRQSQGDLAIDTSKMLLRLWDFTFRELKLDHSRQINSGVVDVYLCWGGKAGGEQRFDDESERGRKTVRVNTIYVYDLASFKDPVEKAREIAHEYGHAVIPPLGIYTGPEDWANGYLGEKLYLRWIRDELKLKRYGAPDAMGAELPGLDAWVKNHVDPLVEKAALQGPGAKLTGGKEAMDNYMGLMLYVDQIFGHGVFSRVFRFAEPTKPDSVWDAVAASVEELPRRKVSFPPNLVGKTVWLPISTGTFEGAPILNRKAGWVQFRVPATPVTVAGIAPEG